ncbi:MAG: ceramidase domain-containing protein [Hyphomicrobiaceae bacterium]
MSLTDKVFRYCERAQDPSFWAEPFNALSNVGFLLVATWAARRAIKSSVAGPHHTLDDTLLASLIALAFAIGIGSFLFHTFATRWSRVADVAPIALFMIGYLGFALRVYLACTTRQILAAVTVFLAATAIAATISCPTQLSSIATFSREPCLKGTMGYAPALMALILTGKLLHRRHPAGRALLLAAGLFLTAMLLRWLDARSCSMSVLFGRPRGTHALWHLLNAATIYVLLHAALTAIESRRRA